MSGQVPNTSKLGRDARKSIIHPHNPPSSLKHKKAKLQSLRNWAKLYILTICHPPIESTQHLHLYNPIVPLGWEKTHLYRNENLSPSPLTTYSADRLTAIGLIWIIGFDCYWDRLYILEVPAEVVFSPVKQSRYWYILSGRVAGPGINV